MDIAVVHPVRPADHVAQGVVQRRPGLFHRQTREVRTHERLTPSSEVGGGVHSDRERDGQPADPLLRQDIRDRVGARRVERLDAVRQRVEARRGGEPTRHTRRQRRVVDDDAGSARMSRAVCLCSPVMP